MAIFISTAKCQVNTITLQSAEWPIDTAFSRNPKPPALAGGEFKWQAISVAVG